MSRKVTVFALALVFGLFTAGQAAAQDVSVGVKGGINISDMDVSGDAVDIATDTKTGFIAGGWLNVGIGDYFGIQPEFLYSQKGFEDADVADAKAKLDYFEVPVLFQLMIPVENSPVRPMLYAGPAISFEATCEVEEGETTTDCADLAEPIETKSTDFGAVFGAGLGFDVGQALVTIEGRYNLGLADINDVADDTTELKNRAFSIMAGVGFQVN